MNARLTRSVRVEVVVLLVMVTAIFDAAAVLSAHTVYGVPARGAVVVAPARPVVVVPPPRPVVVAPAPVVVAHPAVVVAPAPVVAMPAGYIAVLPHGYTMVTVHGGRYYYAGGVHYQATFYQGRTCYVRVRF